MVRCPLPGPHHHSCTCLHVFPNGVRSCMSVRACVGGWVLLFLPFSGRIPLRSSSQRRQPGALPSEQPSMPEQLCVTFPPKGQRKQKHLRKDLQHKFSTFLGEMITSSFPTLPFSPTERSLFNGTTEPMRLTANFPH